MNLLGFLVQDCVIMVQPDSILLSSYDGSFNIPLKPGFHRIRFMSFDFKSIAECCVNLDQGEYRVYDIYLDGIALY